MLSGTRPCVIPAQSLVSNVVIASLCQSLYPPGLDPFPWWRDSTAPAPRTCHERERERGEWEASQRSWTVSGCVPAAPRPRGAPAAMGRSWVSAAVRMMSCAAERAEGWGAFRFCPASAEWDWPGSLRRSCCWLALSDAVFWKKNNTRDDTAPKRMWFPVLQFQVTLFYINQFSLGWYQNLF